MYAVTYFISLFLK